MAARARKKKPAPRSTETWSAAHSIRFGDDDWDALKHKAAPHGGNSTVIRKLVRVYLENPMVADVVERTPDPVADRTRQVLDPSTDRRLSANGPDGVAPRRTRARTTRTR